MSDELTRLESELAILEQRLQTQNATNSTLESELAQLQQTRLGVKKRYDDLSAEVKSLEKKKAALKASLQELEPLPPPSGAPSAESLGPSQEGLPSGVNAALLSDEQTSLLKRLQSNLSEKKSATEKLGQRYKSLRTGAQTQQEALSDLRQRLEQKKAATQRLEQLVASLKEWQLPLTNAQR